MVPCAVGFGGVVGNIDRPLVATTGAALFARPKSRSFATGGADAAPLRTRKTLAGFRSRVLPCRPPSTDSGLPTSPIPAAFIVNVPRAHRVAPMAVQSRDR